MLKSDEFILNTRRPNRINLKQKPPIMGKLRPHEPYMLQVEDAFSIHGEGCIITGFLRGGRMSVGDHVWIVADGMQKPIVIEAMKIFVGENLDKAQKAVWADADTRVGIWTRDASADEMPEDCVIRSNLP